MRTAVGDKFVGKRPSEVSKDPSLYAAVLKSSDVEKSVRLAFARDIDSAKIRDALCERLRPALGEGSASLKEFEAYFDGLTFKKGQALTFSAVGGKLHTVVLGKHVGTISDPKLCVALFDAYLGEEINEYVLDLSNLRRTHVCRRSAQPCMIVSCMILLRESEHGPSPLVRIPWCRRQSRAWDSNSRGSLPDEVQYSRLRIVW